METFHLRLFMVLCLGINWSAAEVLQRQKRNWIIDSFSINEGHKGPFPYSLGKVNVEKKFTRFKIHGEGADKDPVGILKIDENTGEIKVYGPVDYESKSKFELTFEALDRNTGNVDTRLGIEILIEDDNDEIPTFNPLIYRIPLKEATMQGNEIITIQAVDRDTKRENKMIDLRIVSTSPEPEDLVFYFMEVNHETGTGRISFKGCLDHEKAAKYTLLVEAKDRGIEKQLSSTCTVIISLDDGNNHIPKITGSMGPNRVEEGVKDIKIVDFTVSDSDTGLDARRVHFKIKGNKTENFNIQYSDEEGKGYLYVGKALDFETQNQLVLNISVENDMPYSTCKVIRRSDESLWQVQISESDTISGLGETLDESSFITTVFVDNVNEAPNFKDQHMTVVVQENCKTGTYLYTLEATDPDITSQDTWVYVKGEDLADWLHVDSKTGKITTTKVIDRESSFVKESTYTILVYAVDDGDPVMTGTGTFTLIINDDNDNVPTLTTTTLQMCQDDEPSTVNLTAFDADADPFGGPFRFKVLGDVKDKWKVVPPLGETVKLVKEVTVHSGVHPLMVELMDRQGQSIVHNVTVKVCECTAAMIPNCDSRKGSGSRAGAATIGIIFLSILLLAGLLLLALFLSCKDKFKTTEMPCEDSGRLMSSNTENPGTDCKVGCEQKEVKKIKSIRRQKRASLKGADVTDMSKKFHGGQQMWVTNESHYSKMGRFREQEMMRGNYAHLSMGTEHWGGFDESYAHETEILQKVIETMQQKLKATGGEQYDYEPNVYAEEGEEGAGDFELDAISISEVGFDANSRLDPKFTALADICMAGMPNNITAHHRASSSVVETLPGGSYGTASSRVWETLPSPVYHTTSVSVSKPLPITSFNTTSSGGVETHQSMKVQKTQQKFHHTDYVEYSGVTSQREMGGSFFVQ